MVHDVLCCAFHDKEGSITAVTSHRLSLEGGLLIVWCSRRIAA